MVHKLTAPQFSTLVTLLYRGPCSQNELGRLCALDQVTIKGIVDRLRKRGLIQSREDQVDRRRFIIELTERGRKVALEAVSIGPVITADTLAPLSSREQRIILDLLRRLS